MFACNAKPEEGIVYVRNDLDNLNEDRFRNTPTWIND